jgi:microcystin-dependent protein
MLGSTYGGNGITIAGLPDLGNRLRVPLGGGRLTSAGSGINGNAFGASGGDERLQSHTHTANVSDPGHNHPVPIPLYNNDPDFGVVPGGSGSQTGTYNATANSNTTGISVSNATTGAGSAGNVQPTLVFGMAFIRAG